MSMLNVGQKVGELRRMTVGDLRREYAVVFGEVVPGSVPGARRALTAR